jgi:hypothetical protein
VKGILISSKQRKILGFPESLAIICIAYDISIGKEEKFILSSS